MNARARRRFDLNIWNNLAQFKSTLNFAPPEIVGNAVADPLWRRAVAAAARCAACGPSPCARRPSRTLRSATRPGVPRARTVFRACPVRSSADACVVRVESADNHPQRSSAVFRRATPGPPCVRGRMAQHVRGLPGRRRACAAAAVMQVWPARAGFERCSSAERRAPVRLRRRRPIVPPRSTKRTACRASAARRASSPAFRRARAAVALSPFSSTLSSLVR